MEKIRNKSWFVIFSKTQLFKFRKTIMFIFFFLIPLSAFLLWVVLSGLLIPRVSLIFGGSTSVWPTLKKLKEEIEADPEKKFNFDYQPIGSTGGIAGVVSNRFEIGFLSKDYNSDGLNKSDIDDIQHIEFAREKTAFVYSLPRNCQISGGGELSVSKNEIRNIYSSENYDWNRLSNVTCDGAAPMYRIVRENGSGTQKSFENIFLRGEPATGFDSTEKNGSVIVKYAKENRGVIGFVGGTELGKIEENSGFKALEIDGVSFSESGSDYLFSRPFILLFRRSRRGEKNKIEDFLKFLSSTKQKINEIPGVSYTYSYPEA